jgi:hypothetical protein
MNTEKNNYGQIKHKGEIYAYHIGRKNVLLILQAKTILVSKYVIKGQVNANVLKRILQFKRHFKVTKADIESYIHKNF